VVKALMAEERPEPALASTDRHPGQS
jgi:hypothetical protein